MRRFLVYGFFSCLLSTAACAQGSGDPVAGQKAFTVCKSCHQLGKNSIGPNLIGVVGRRAASYEGFSYSLALRNAHVVWDEPNLHTWLRNPGAKVPGTKMLFQGLSDDRKINDIIAYLSTLR